MLANKDTCNKCKLSSKTTNPNILSSYPKDKKIDIAFLGECPGAEEELEGRPFVGAAGKNLDLALDLADKSLKERGLEGISRKDVFIGNVVRCRATDSSGKKNRTPDQNEIKACVGKVISEIKALRPRMIICLGLSAAKAIMKDKSITMGNNHGGTFDGRSIFGYPCVISMTWHPSPTTFQYGPDRQSQMNTDIISAINYVREAGKIVKKSWSEVSVTDYGTWEKVRGDFIKSKYFVLDLETTTLNERLPEAALTNVGLAHSIEYGVSIVCDEALWEPGYLEKVLIDVDGLMLSGKCLIAHNMKFDCKYYYKTRNVWAKNWFWDTMLAHAILDPLSSTKLKDIAKRYTSMGGYEHELIKFGGIEASSPIERVEYNISDCICTLQIALMQQPALQKRNQMDLFLNIVMPACEILAEMEYQGVCVDMDTIQNLKSVYTKRIQGLKKDFYLHPTVNQYIKTVGGFNPNSKEQLRTILFDPKFMGFAPIKKTGGNKPSVDKEVLQILSSGGNTFATQLLEFSGVTKLYSTYIEGMQKNAVNSRVHTTYHQDVAVTGRTSSSGVNLQNIPKASDIKNIFRADNHHLFLACDFKQMELVVSTFYTLDPIMIEALLKGDAHSYIAMQLFGIPEDKVGEKRTWVKAINFGVFYGMGPEALAKQLKITSQESKSLIDEYFKLFKASKNWIASVRRDAEVKGVVLSKFNRARYYDSKNRPEELNSAVNHPIQSLASDLMLYGMQLWKKYLVSHGYTKEKARIALQVHDEIITSADRDLIPELAVAKKKVLESISFPFMTMPLSVDLAVGKSWGELVDFEIKEGYSKIAVDR